MVNKFVMMSSVQCNHLLRCRQKRCILSCERIYFSYLLLKVNLLFFCCMEGITWSHSVMNAVGCHISLVALKIREYAGF